MLCEKRFAKKWFAQNLLDRYRQRVMVLANKPPQIRPDLAGSFKARGLGGGLLIFRQCVRAFGVMLEIAKNADGKEVPCGPLIAHKDEILWLLQGFRVCIFHLAFFV